MHDVTIKEGIINSAYFLYKMQGFNWWRGVIRCTHGSGPDNFRCNLSTNPSGLTAIMACPTNLLLSSVGSSRPNCCYFVRYIPCLLKSLIISTNRAICMSWPFGATMEKFFSCRSFPKTKGIQEDKIPFFFHKVSLSIT